MVFIDLEKAYHSVQRRFIWDSLESRGVPGKYVDLIRDMYDRTKTSVRALVGDTNSFPIEVGLHQGSALSPFLFAVVLDELSKSIQETVPCNVGDNDDTQITIEGQVVPQVTKFKYLGSFVQKDGEIDSDVAHRIQVGWCKWRVATGVLCDKRFPTKLKGKFYRVAVRSAMLYGTECWATKKTQMRKMEVAEIRMLRWMCGHTRLDRIRNEVIRERLGVARISDKIKEGRLRWFGHVNKRQSTAPVRAVETLTVEGRRSRGLTPKLTWDERIRHDLLELHLTEDMVHDRSSWRRKIKVKDF
ncbi:uncharacterized protein LOC110908170 [Helianthus annuus]|uniref:uncharacterized protein LOC110908170 n=1 Tax=Helianthus annuus TaxID=4232 RepID=UPI001652EB2B|nr:uncharacterized protein LOC110908170 [Helianthus annuus]